MTFWQVWRNPWHCLAFGFGSGCVKWAPGTAGTVCAVLLYLLLPPLAWYWYLLIVVAAFVAGIWICERTSNEMGVHDPGGIVWDEFVQYTEGDEPRRNPN